ncbi:unnamed protein product [Taenia asiatica]|uniref:Uncharacterized protein n=1 Tax=Taenia asiatica TaxID=60517 RepID=A0A0R3VSQ3_TAEAS|nr:unnamed protein product [Taenia asiatica]
MDDLGKDVAYFTSILNSICIEEQKAEDLYQDIRTGFKKSVVQVKRKEDEGEKEEELSESLIQEIENALSKARLALEKSELRAEKSNKISNQSTNYSQLDKKALKTPNRVNSDKSKSQRQTVVRGITSDINKCISSTSKNRPRIERARVQAQNINGPKTTDCWELNPNVVERINDVIALSKSVEEFSKEAHLSTKDTSARDSFLAYCNSLSSNTSGDIDILISRRYFAENLPKLLELLKQFFQVLDVIDWNVATPGQHQWRDQMLENLIALFNIAEHFKPLLLGDENTTVKIADPPRQRDSAPSIETIWRAYVCSGQKVPASYTDPPVEIPSRGFRLTFGPAVFSNDPEVHRDLQQMVDLWSDIFRLQRRLRFLDYIETRLLHWLRLIAEQPTYAYYYRCLNVFQQ